MSFKNKITLVTGSSSGIGRTTALEFCKNGATVILNGRNELKLKETQQTFNELGYDVDYFVADISLLNDCISIKEFIIQKYQKIDVVVANASLSMNGRFEDSEPNFYKETIDSNIYSVIMPLFTFLPHIKRSNGSFTIIGSIAGMHGLPTASAYCVGKMALTALHQSLLAELSIYKIHIGIIYLGFTENDEGKLTYCPKGKLIPVPKRNAFLLQTQEHVARSILKMIKDRRSKMIMGLTGKLTYYVSRFLPQLFIWLTIRNQKKQYTSAQLLNTITDQT